MHDSVRPPIPGQSEDVRYPLVVGREARAVGLKLAIGNNLELTLQAAVVLGSEIAEVASAGAGLLAHHCCAAVL